MLKIYFRRILDNKLVLIGSSVILALILIAIFAPFFAPYDPVEQNLIERLQSPSSKHIFGTDDLGRDVLSRMIYGTRVYLSVGFVAVSITVIIGTILGLLAGYSGKISDNIIMRFVDIMLCFPSFFLILMVIAFLGPSIYNIMIVIGLTSWSGLARLVRGEVLSIKEREFIYSAEISGLSGMRIMFVHILPNVIGPIVVSATLGIAGAILSEAALSFLGLGVQPPTASWGNILTSGKDYLHIAWWLSLFPGLALLLTILSFNLAGEGLRDVFDPKVWGRF